MPDISMCGSATCPLAKTCYRNELSGTKPNEFRQSYFYALKEEGEDCRYYWKTTKERKGECKWPTYVT
jgi:hypothetical protein